MTLNLITDAWIPVATRAGDVRKVRPAEIVDADVVSLAFPRPDFNGAITEFLIGLLSTAFAPADEAEWLAQWTTRPSVADLDQAFEPLRESFCLTHFMQRQENLKKTEPIEILFIDAAGENAEGGRDLMNRRSISALSPAMAAAALIAHQLYATTGGSGYAVSIRAGGPLTTLVASGDDLWGRVWPNVETREQLAARAVTTDHSLPAMLPWLRPADEAVITPDNAAPQMVYWATPRRVKLVFSDGGLCSLTGETCEVMVREIARENKGTTYAGWSHPMAPYYLDGSTWRAVRARPEPVGYRSWLGLVQATPDDDRRPAAVVSQVRLHRWQLGDVRLVAHGFASTQATVHRWTEGEMPIVLDDPDARQEREVLARLLVAGAGTIAGQVGDAVRRSGGIKWRAVDAFWRDTEKFFLNAIRSLLDLDADDTSRPIRERWLTQARRVAYDVFDAGTNGDLSARRIEEVVAERYWLARMLRGYDKSGEKLMAALELPTPKAKEAA